MAPSDGRRVSARDTGETPLTLTENKRENFLFTVRNSSSGKVMFLHLFVIFFAGVVHGGGMRGGGVCGMHGKKGGVCGGGHAWQGACVEGEAYMCGRRDGHYSGRYAPYWNAFLFIFAAIPYE